MTFHILLDLFPLPSYNHERMFPQAELGEYKSV